MKNLGKITDPKDIITKEYIDEGIGKTVNTLEDNVAMAESDIETLQTDVQGLKTDNTATKAAVKTLQDTYVPNTRKVNNKALEADITLTASDIGALPTTGGTLTGDLKVGSANIGTNGYLQGTWLQGAAANHMTSASTKIAVQDGDGWIYHRTATELLSDIGALPDTYKSVFIVNTKYGADGNITGADKTFEEITEAYNKGLSIYVQGSSMSIFWRLLQINSEGVAFTADRKSVV